MDKSIKFSGAEFFSAAAVYILRRGNQTLYIGATQNVYKRFSVHHIMQRHVIEDTDEIEIIYYDNKTAAHNAERELISILHPIWNGTPGRSGKGTGKGRDFNVTFRDREDEKQSKAYWKEVEVHLPKEVKDKLDFRGIDKILRHVDKKDKYGM